MTRMFFSQIDNEDWSKSLNLTRTVGQCFTLESDDAPLRFDVPAPDGLPGFAVEAGGAGPIEPLTRDEYLAIVEVAGLQDTGSTVDDERVKAEAFRAARAIMDEPISEMGLHRGFGLVAVWRAQAVLRSFGVPPAECTIGEVAHAPRRSLLQDGRAGKALLEALRAEDERALQRERAVAEARAAATRVNMRTLGELSIEAILIPKAGDAGPAADMTATNAFPICSDDECIVYAYRAVAGWEAPAGPIGPGQFLPRSYVPRVLESALAVPDPNDVLVEWILSARSRHDFDRGPVDFGLRDRVVTLLGVRERRARELAERWAKLLYHSCVTPGSPHWWRRRWLPEAIVRGLRVRPELAAVILTKATEDVLESESTFVIPASIGISEQVYADGHKERMKRTARKEPRTVRRAIPRPIYPFDRAEAERVCLAAAAGGHMAAGALLDESPPPPPALARKTATEKRSFSTPERT